VQGFILIPIPKYINVLGLKVVSSVIGVCGIKCVEMNEPIVVLETDAVDTRSVTQVRSCLWAYKNFIEIAALNQALQELGAKEHMLMP
jgi:hypothetical protein